MEKSITLTVYVSCICPVLSMKLCFWIFLKTYFLNLFSFLQTLRALELLQKFENIAGVQLYLHDKYQRILMQYGRYY